VRSHRKGQRSRRQDSNANTDRGKKKAKRERNKKRVGISPKKSDDNKGITRSKTATTARAACNSQAKPLQKITEQGNWLEGVGGENFAPQGGKKFVHLKTSRGGSRGHKAKGRN